MSVMAGQDYLSLFDVAADPDLINGLRQISDLQNHSTRNEPSDEEKDSGPRDKVGMVCGEVSERKQCSACQCCFESREEQMEHYKLDWHRFNLRQRLAGRPPLGADEFERRTGTGDVSSISGSDSEDDDSNSDDDDVTKDEDDDDDVVVNGGGRLSSRVLFQNVQGQYLCVYRCALQNRTLDADTDATLTDPLLKISRHTLWVILMTGGGHFAGAVYQGKDVLQHKTFHRYTVRAKRGTAQSVRDARGHAPKSAGSALRRYNEAALTKDIQELLKSWTGYLEQAAAIFLRTPKYNRSVFFGGRGAPLGKKDPRIQTVPFATRRATFSEVTRVHGVLSAVQVYDASADVAHLLSPCKRVWNKKASNPTKRTSAEPEGGQQQEEEEEEEEEEEGSVDLEVVDVTLSTLDLKEYEVKARRRKRRKGNNRKPVEKETSSNVVEPQQGPDEAVLWEFSLRDVLYTACKTGDLETLQTVLQRETHTLHQMFNTPIDLAGYTLLHVASAAAQKQAVHLLLEAGSDPACRDKKGQTPYAVAPDKETRNMFRKFMAENPDKYNYAKAQVPAPLGAEITTKKAEKKKAQKSAKKQREKEQKEQRRKEELEQEEKKRFSELSDREKRALAAERRLAEQAAVTGVALSNISRCWKCGETLLGKVPFHYLEFSFCSTSCVQAHRKSSSTAKS